MKIALTVDTIKALLPFAGKSDVRYYLNGVLIETGPQRTVAVTTCGSTLAVAEIPMLGEAPANIILPRDALEQAIKVAGKSGLIVAEFAPGDRKPDAPRAVSLECGATIIQTREIDGQFPDWRRVMPREASGQLAHYDPELLARVQKAERLLTVRRSGFACGIAHNGQAPGLSHVTESFVAIVMPMRMDPPPTSTAPDWMLSALDNRAQSAAVAA